ncbi:MAG: hypothetical protein NC131_04885 [Roseburia sp.]|nr:hypothetical protein [Roseburia sp.]
MNKLTKLLSVFVIAGAIGAGVAGAVGCNKGSGTPKHEHKYTYTVDDTDATKHKGHCAEDGCDAPDITDVHHWNDQNKCKECNAEKPSEGGKLEVAADIDGLIVEGISNETIALSTTKTSHDIDKSAIRVYFATGSTKKTEVPAANFMLRLRDPGNNYIDTWTGLKTDGQYTVLVNLKDCEMAEGAEAEVADIYKNIVITVSNPVTTLSIKDGATLTQVAGPDTISAGWTFEITRANGDKTDVTGVTVTGVDTVTAGQNKTANLSYKIGEKTVTGSVTYSVTEDTSKVSQSYALNFGSFDATQTADIAAGKKVTLQEGRFEVQSVNSGAIDNHNNSIGTKYFTKRLKTNGSSTAAASDGTGQARYIKVHADGAGTLTIYAYNNGGNAGDGATRGVTVYSGVTFNEKGKLLLDAATPVGETKDIPSKSGESFSVSIPAAGDYYITNTSAMTYCYVQLDQLVDKETNEAITLGGTKVYSKLKVSHESDDGETKFKGSYKLGDTFTVDAGYTFKAESINNVTCEMYEDETITEGLTFFIGETNITSGYAFGASDIGEKTVTVKLGDATATYTILVESEVPGVLGISAAVKDTVVTELDSATAKLTLNKSDIETSIVKLEGATEEANLGTVTVKYYAKGADVSTATDLGESAELGVGDYVLVVTANVSGSDKNADFTATVKLSITDKTAPIVIKADDYDEKLSDAGIDNSRITVTTDKTLNSTRYQQSKVDATATYDSGTAEDTSDDITFTQAWVPSGNVEGTEDRGFTITAKADVQVVVYFTICDGSFSVSNRAGSLKWTVTPKGGEAGTAQSGTAITPEGLKVYAETITLKEGDSVRVSINSTGSSKARYALFGLAVSLDTTSQG